MARRVRVRTRVVAPSSGYAARTRLRVTPQERALLTAVGEQLTRMRVADLPAAVCGESANERSKRPATEFGVTARYAETACVDNNAAVKAARQCLYADRRRLRAAGRPRGAAAGRAAAVGLRLRAAPGL